MKYTEVIRQKELASIDRLMREKPSTRPLVCGFCRGKGIAPHQHSLACPTACIDHVEQCMFCNGTGERE